MIIEIVRAARVALFDTEVQSLQPGQIYTVAPAIGAVLVSDGWAREVDDAAVNSGGSASTAAAAHVQPLIGICDFDHQN